MFARFRGASGKLFDVLAPGLYAWGVTVGWPVSQRFAPLGSRLGALNQTLLTIENAGELPTLTDGDEESVSPHKRASDKES